MSQTADPRPYDFFVLAISIFGLLLLGVRAIVPLDGESQRLFDQCDLVLCAFFFLDFLRNLKRAENATADVVWLAMTAP